jgi:hypothetical protein
VSGEEAGGGEAPISIDLVLLAVRSRVVVSSKPFSSRVAPISAQRLGFALVLGVTSSTSQWLYGGFLFCRRWSAGCFIGEWGGAPAGKICTPTPVRGMMAVCLHRSLVEGFITVFFFHFTRVASGGNPRRGYLGDKAIGNRAR